MEQGVFLIACRKLLKPSKNGTDVWLCEGEKDADNLRTLGLDGYRASKIGKVNLIDI